MTTSMPERCNDLLDTERVIDHPVVWRQILEVPSEIWALIATLTGRQSLARLCAVSQDFYAMFSPLLYSTTSDPPLTKSQSSVLIKILTEVDISTSQSPVQLIRSLSVPDCWEIKAQEGHNALRKLFEISMRHPVLRGSALRTLEWNSTGTDDLECSFKRLEISQISKKYRSSFVTIPDLEKMECCLMLYSDDEEITDDETEEERTVDEIETVQSYAWRSSCQALGEALKLLPSSSPLLRTLSLKLVFYSGNPPWDAYVDLISTVNGMRFSALTSVEFSVDAAPEDYTGNHPRHMPVADFSSFLFEHPFVTNVTLKVVGMSIPSGPNYLPRLRSFVGSVEHCAAIAARAQELEELFVVIPDRWHRSQEHPQDPPLFTSKLYPPNLSLTVKRFKVFAIQENGSVESARFRRELCPPSLECLVSAFPNITQLEVALSEQMNHYQDSFAALLGLERLCIRDNIYVEREDWTKPAKIIFPVAEYTSVINTTLLPFTSQLSDVHFMLRGERFIDEDTLGCPCCDDGWFAPWKPDLLVEYRFHVNRQDGKAKLVLVAETVVGDEVSDEPKLAE
ncbi:hypothetical protein C8R44DRAFT_873648 [Mycena epipterygia]|nr:hypothetical protein C8R44DRAFT_873648 [Mycena epipterygia]